MNLPDLSLPDLSALTGLLPKVLGGVLILVVGLLFARAAGRGAAWLVRRTHLDALAERAGVARLLYAIGFKRSFPDLVDWLVWGAASLVVLSLLAEAGGLPGLAEGIAAVVQYLPRVLASAVILVAGLVGSDILRGLVDRVARRNEELETPGMISQAVYYGGVVVSFSMAAEQLGIDTGLIDSLILVTVAAGAGGAALALALSARPTLQHVVARHYAERMFQVGDEVRLDGVEGTLERFGPVTAWIRTEDGTVAVPVARLLSDPVRLGSGPPQS